MMNTLKQIYCFFTGHKYNNWYSEYEQFSGDQKVYFFCSKCGKHEFNGKERYNQKYLKQ